MKRQRRHRPPSPEQRGQAHRAEDRGRQAVLGRDRRHREGADQGAGPAARATSTPTSRACRLACRGLEERHQELLDKGGDRIEVRSNPAYSRAKLSLNGGPQPAEGGPLRSGPHPGGDRTAREGASRTCPVREAEQAALDRRYEALQKQHNELQLRLGSSELQLALERQARSRRASTWCSPPPLEPLSDRNGDAAPAPGWARCSG